MNFLSKTPLDNINNINIFSEQISMECLINCFLREYGLPARIARFTMEKNDIPSELRVWNGRYLRLSVRDGTCVLAVEHVSTLGRCHIASHVFMKRSGSADWRRLDIDAFSHALLYSIAPEGDHSELIMQIRNSCENMKMFQHHRKSVHHADSIALSEQGQVWGHAFHPAPKSRSGVSGAHLLHASPEVRATFQLFWFRVHPSLYHALGTDPRSLLADISGENDLYPCHPWEAERILDDPVFATAMRDGLIAPVGECGRVFIPTSSVRTLYHPDVNAFLKFSINVRLTNCVRKNSWYELESAVFLTRFLAPDLAALERSVPGFAVLREPSATSLDFSRYGDESATRRLSESFGILYREQISPGLRSASRPRVAMSIFTNAAETVREAACLDMLQHAAERLEMSLAGTARLWMRRYAALLCEGVLTAHALHGIILEPHLQNVVVGFDANDLPAYIWVRDLEGTKLLRSHWSTERFAEISETVRDSFLYDEHKAYQRTVYCLLVNNIAEAIFHISWAAGLDEALMWSDIASILRDTAKALRAKGADAEWILSLVHGAPLPAKTNLLTRLKKAPDRDAGYIALPSPFAGRNA